MSLVFEAIQTEGLAEISYLIGDDEEGIAAVFDPRADVEVYLELARAKNVAITHIFETHIHADLVSGARELQGRVESAKIYVSHEGGARYGFENEKVSDGDKFTLGSVIITARHTPGPHPGARFLFIGGHGTSGGSVGSFEWRLAFRQFGRPSGSAWGKGNR